jgi:predicted dehydrogenase
MALQDQRRPRIAVIGTGWWATQHHIPGLLNYPGAELVALVDKDPAKLARAAEAFSGPASFRSLEDLLSSSTEVDGIVVATPSAYHYEIARAALQAGKSVMVEKPMVFRAREAWELVDLANRRGLHLQVGYTYQFTKAARLLHDIVSTGGIGEILQVSGLFASMVESYYRGKPQDYEPVFHFPLFGPGELTYSDPIIAGGGHGQTQLTHAAAMVVWVTGLAADEVMAYMEKRDLSVDLVDAIAWRFQNGAVGTLGGTGNIRPGQPQQQELRYYGTEGFALQDLVAATVQVYYADGRVEAAGPEDPSDTYPAEATARGFADLIAGRGPNMAPGELGARVVEFLEAAYRSAERGTPVRVAELSQASHSPHGGH